MAWRKYSCADNFLVLTRGYGSPGGTWGGHLGRDQHHAAGRNDLSQLHKGPAASHVEDEAEYLRFVGFGSALFGDDDNVT